MVKRIAAGFGIGFALSLVLVVWTISTTEVPPVELKLHGYVFHFAPPANGFETLLLEGDGQAYASIAQDPLLLRPDLFGEGRAQEAFFAQRPLYSYSAWVVSGGQPAALQTAFIVVSAIAGGLLVAATVALLEGRGAGGRWLFAPLVLLLPNVVIATRSFTPDVLATGLALGGLALWSRDPGRRGLAVVAFVLAVLARESTLVIPAVVIAYELAHHRFRPKHLLIAGFPVAAYLLWMAFVRHQLQSGPETIARNSSFAVPFAGLSEGASRWSATDLVMVALLVAVSLGVAVVNRRRVEAWIILAYLASSVILNDAIWQS